MTQKFLIYGGGGGVGSTVARRLKSQGADLHLAGRSAERLAALSKELGVTYTAGDVRDEHFFEQVAAEAGEDLAGLVYAVGTINLKGFQRLESKDYLEDYQINALGAALATKASLQSLRRDKGASVVLYSSVAAGKGFSFHASIAMAKSAVEGLVRSLAVELAPGIRVNAVAPSLTRTPLAEKIVSNEKTAESIARMHPLQRLGTADDIAAATLFLLSDEAAWMTGQVVGVDGGRSTLCEAL